MQQGPDEDNQRWKHGERRAGSTEPHGSADALTHEEQSLVLLSLRRLVNEGENKYRADAARLAERLLLAWARPPNDELCGAAAPETDDNNQSATRQRSQK